MMLAKLRQHKKILISLLIISAFYVWFSYVAGVPLGFGKMIARHHINNYCGAIFPYEDITLENLGYNIKTMSYGANVLTESA